jgi:hypothetical protein
MNKPSREEFAEIITEVLLAQGFEGQIVFDRAQFQLLQKNRLGQVLTQINLTSYYAEFCTSPNDDDRQQVIARIRQNSNVAIPDLYQDAETRLYPHIKDRWEVTQMNLQLQSGALGGGSVAEHIRVPSGSFAEFFSTIVAYDIPGSRMYLSSAEVGKWKLQFSDIFENALINLVRRSHGEYDTLMNKENNSKTYYSRWNDGYDASRVLAGELFAELSVNGDCVVFIPDADRLIVTGSEDILGLMIGLTEAKMAQEKPKPLPPIPILIKNRELSRFVLPPDSPVAFLAKELEVLYLNRIYEEQKQLLEGTLDSLQNDIFISKYMAVKKDGKIGSRCVWSEGVPALLPKAEHISFMREENNEAKLLAQGRLSRIIGIVGDLLEPTEHYPPRYKVQSFPNATQLARIGQEELF